MPKRPCPFEDSFQSQLKVHVRTRHVNEGVMKKTKMAEVYDRTIKMLFSGSQRQSQASLDCLNNNDGKTAPAIGKSTQLQLPLQQMEITADGRLAPPPKVCGNSPANAKKPCLSEALSSCAYCDTPVQHTHLRPCSECVQEFCPSCSFSEYHDEGERVKCLSCF